MISIIHVNTERTWRGGEKQVFHLASQLPADEFRSVIAAPQKSALFDKAVENGIPVVRLRSTGELSLRQYFDLKYAVKKYQAQLIHVHTSHGLISAAMVRDIAKLPVKVIYSRRTDFHLRTGFLGISRKKYLWGTDQILSVSDGIKRVLIEDGIPESRIQTIYSGIDIDALTHNADGTRFRHEFEIPENAVVVGMVAAFAPHKDPFNFIEAARIIHTSHPDVWFVFAGAGSMWDEVNTRISQTSLASRFILPGFRRDVPDILNALDVFCISSREEGLCTSILDAMAMSLPVASTLAGGIPEAVEDGVTGLLAPVGDSKALAENISQLIDDRQLRTVMGQAGRNRAEAMFNIRYTVEKTAAFYRKLATAVTS